jgi:hypothetical protein
MRAECLEELARPLRRLLAAQPKQPAHEQQVLPSGQIRVDRRDLTGQAHPSPDRVGLFHDVMTEDARRSRVGTKERREHPDHGGLARPVGPEDGEDRSFRDEKVDAVQRSGLAERLDEPGGLDRRSAVCIHRVPPYGEVTV